MAKKRKEVEGVDYIDLTPTWCGLLPAMFAILENPEVPYKSKQVIKSEFWRMAKAVDSMNAKAKGRKK